MLTRRTENARRDDGYAYRMQTRQQKPIDWINIVHSSEPGIVNVLLHFAQARIYQSKAGSL